MVDKAENKISLGVALWFSGTGRRLMRWEKNDLINRDQLFAIMDFEKAHNGKRMIRSLIAIAIFAISLGVLSIIAANWMHIPGPIKIIAHLVLSSTVAWKLFKANKDDNEIWREGLTFLFFGLNLTLIVLIGQVYQLDGNYAAALSTWLLISSPAVFMFGKSIMNALAWITAFLATVFAHLVNLLEVFEFDDEYYVFLITFSLGFIIPLSLLAAGALKPIREKAPEWGHTLYYTGVFLMVIQATVGSFLWYGDIGDELSSMFEGGAGYVIRYSLMSLVYCAGIASIYLYSNFRKKIDDEIVDRTGMIFAIVSLSCAALPFLVMAGDSSLLAASHFIGYWVFVGWAGYRMNSQRLMSSAIMFVTLRVLVVYFELFGGLMMTGFGLIFSGLLILGILKVAMNVREKLLLEKAS